ncbi:GTPase HflX [Parvimonas micra]|uniref:GTPase HflX n=1 Tax=Parvimonas micra TaxID=33033 RepID=UPI002004534C|nr:GTPase HflX [Parvimonas micra]MCK6129847.1 GTPase HflX [Parvimonas micra]MCK6135493.1 GTPase HflX [Parvimonas micra]MCK6136965.1 GTPase HflX [Parvimonas micra]MCK6153492.1 GTPase HflX [Parvimonas micra]MCZ7408491.1 GTPase HflX [Parvimonas micra]
MNQRVITVTVNIDMDEKTLEDKVIELEKLVEALDGEVVLSLTQNKSYVDKAFYIGKGKVNEIKDYCEKLDAEFVVFNNELTGSQVKNLEEIIGIRVIDRTNLILDIFSERARTKEAKLQVKLAKLKYTLPRLSALRSGFSRQQGGIGGKGIGEQQIELDRRTINREISSITSQLKEIEKNRNEIRKKRINSKEPIISLVGYTNAGKSTLINKLISYGKDENSEIKEVFVKDMLFATLDTYVREGLLLNGSKVMYVDTVGFVSDIPHNLVESFKGTLEEIKYSDLILHVVDISNANVDEQIKITNDMIKKLECEDKNVIYVFNKVDKLADENIKFQYANIENKVFISAKNDEDIILLLKEIEKVLFSSLVKTELLIPYDKQKIVSNILNNYMPEFVEHIETGSFLKVSLKKEDYEIYKGYEVNEK